MHLNRPARTLSAIMLTVTLLGAPAALAARPAAQSESDAVVLPSPMSWLTQALDHLTGWLTASSNVVSESSLDLTGTDPTEGPMSPGGEGETLPSPDNGPGLDPNG